MFMLNSEAVLPMEGIFVLVGIAVLLVLYIVLRTVKIKKKPNELPVEENDEEIVAAITAAISVMLEEEAEREDREPIKFRVVAFRRTNNRRIGE